ncbi:GNAT family N-acetyltransferase [Corynebacterium canis]|uniref:GNAT family N-acetyltransferase n=1 Tax=Corynebacterium canis TaxID=679663 RepID=A0A5C5UEJ9_9CORY|nr:GNAT family N-acetyltransferase [Corynebacterium canis]TWT24496.1 GNAT family N-acetyltransferase [Corynebacterium canis]WJY76327.1 putative N-acetyltransferase YjcF [Corynebacterium canis]
MNHYFAVSHLSQLSALEVHKLYKLRVDIFVHEQRTPYAEIDDADAAPTTFHVLAWDSEKHLLATARLYPEQDRWHLGRVCVAKQYRGTGLGEETMHQTLRLAFEQDPARDVYLEAQEQHAEFYQKLGFRPIGDAFDWDGVPHIPMVLEKDALAKVFAN